MLTIEPTETYKHIRPWGWYENLDRGTGYLVKKLTVDPNARLSRQYHKNRTEQWYVVAGTGFVELGPDKIPVELFAGSTVMIFQEQSHRLVAGNNGVVIIEIQQGETISVSDIVRLEDDYGRI